MTRDLHKYKEKKKKEEKIYTIKYWIGLMDGDGSIQVNHWRMKGLQYRIAIKLKLDGHLNDLADISPNIEVTTKTKAVFSGFSSPALQHEYSQSLNVELLEKIEKHVGGHVRIDRQRGYVLWVENHSSKIFEILKIFNTYPPCTTRLLCQIEFAKETRLRNSIEWYLANRERKYQLYAQQQAALRQSYIEKLPYYKAWLSGFIEAEACFCCRAVSRGSYSFSIAQKGDLYVLESIKRFFAAKNVIRRLKRKKKSKKSLLSASFLIGQSFFLQDIFSIEIYSRKTLEKIVHHCIEQPLYGEKKRSFSIFRDKILQKLS